MYILINFAFTLKQPLHIHTLTHTYVCTLRWSKKWKLVLTILHGRLKSVKNLIKNKKKIVQALRVVLKVCFKITHTTCVAARTLFERTARVHPNNKCTRIICAFTALRVWLALLNEVCCLALIFSDMLIRTLAKRFRALFCMYTWVDADQYAKAKGMSENESTTLETNNMSETRVLLFFLH